MQAVTQTSSNPGQKARRIRTGKLLGRQYQSKDIFYAEFVPLSPEFVDALNRHLTPLKGKMIALLGATGVTRTAVQSYLNGRSNKTATNGEAKLMPMANYRAIITYLNSEGASHLEPNPTPDKVSGTYIGLLLAWYFDKANPETKGLENPMPAATDDIVQKLAKAGRLEEKLQDERILHALKCLARDRLTGRHGFMPHSVFIQYENAVLASFGLKYTDAELIEQLRPQMREAFEGTDRRISIIDGHSVSAYLEASLESRLAGFAGIVKNPKAYRYNDGFTPPGFNYFEGDWIMHDVFGLGKVVASGANVAKAATEQLRPDMSMVYEYQISVKFDKRPEGKEKDTLPFVVRLKPQLQV